MSDLRVPVLLEIGQRKTFASALEWPGWSRSGKDEAGALTALQEYGSRYESVLALHGVDFKPPQTVEAFEVVSRGKGDATTDFGSPGLLVDQDFEAVGAQEQQRLERVLKACWQAFDEAAAAAEGKELRKGPRGGGRSLAKIMEHMADADGSYLYRLGWKFDIDQEAAIKGRVEQLRAEIIQGLSAKISGKLPDEGPRGGKRWPARYFVRRVAWHALDHTWEIEDRMI